MLTLRVAPGAVFSLLAVGLAQAIVAGGARAWAAGRIWSALPNLVGNALYLVFVLLTIVLLLARPPARARDASLKAWCLAMAGTFGMFLAPLLPGGPLLFDLGSLGAAIRLGALIASLAMSSIALSVLGRSFSLTPEARSVVTTGPYRLVRHPLYLCESIAIGSFLVVSGRVTILVLVGVVLGVQVLRSRLEESVLTAAFPDYQRLFRGVAHFLPGIY